MASNVVVKVVRVFTDESGNYGNPVGIVLDEKREYDLAERQNIAKKISFSETVFINDLTTRSISIYTPQREIPFAGHAVVGTTFFLEQELKTKITQVLGKEGPIQTWSENELTWIKADLQITPPWNYEELKSPEEVEKLSAEDMSSAEHVYVWAWVDKDKGLIRARTFATDWGIPEDEANGSGSMKLAVSLGREITILHGKGSVIHAHSSNQGFAEVGGHAIQIEDLKLQI